jgi:ribonuclease BN (tRNA processing enzyme)
MAPAAGVAGPLRLRFLGSGDAFGSGGRLQTCLCLEGPGGRVLLDCGATALVAMKSAGIDPATVGWILLTHLHGDHFGGVPFVVLDGQFARRETPLVVAGPPGTPARVTAGMEILFPGSSRVTRRFATDLVEIVPGYATPIGPLTVTAFPVEHASGAPSYALRVAWAGKVVAYSGDTEWCEALVDAARGADLFVCEAYTFERRIRFHLDHATLARNLGRIGARRVILTHLGPEMLLHRSESAAECADDGLVVEV